jgi:hypothetical protein
MAAEFTMMDSCIEEAELKCASQSNLLTGCGATSGLILISFFFLKNNFDLLFGDLCKY